MPTWVIVCTGAHGPARLAPRRRHRPDVILSKPIQCTELILAWGDDPWFTP